MIDSKFNGCDAEAVLNYVNSHMRSVELASLWERMCQEIKRNGSDGAISYLRAEFARIKKILEKEIDKVGH